jgi:hypothetical protein
VSEKLTIGDIAEGIRETAAALRAPYDALHVRDQAAIYSWAQVIDDHLVKAFVAMHISDALVKVAEQMEKVEADHAT